MTESESETGTETVRLSLDVSAVPADPVGAGRYTIHLAEALGRRNDVAMGLWCRKNDRRRWEAIAPTPLPGPTEPAGPVGRAGQGGAERRRRGEVPWVEAVVPEGRPARLVWEQARLGRRLRETDAEVHHGPHYTMAERAQLAQVVTIHDLTFLEHPEWHEKSKVVVFRRAIKVAARRATGLICVSGRTGEKLEELCGPVGRVFVIPHGVDHAQFRPQEPEEGSDEEALGRLGIRRPYIVFVGTLEPRKAVPELVAAFDRIADGDAEVSLVLVGGAGWGMGEIEKAIGSARHRDRVVRPGYVADRAVPALLRGAGVAVYPSVEEGFGLPALEALACGTPLVTTAGTAMAEVSGDAAVLVGAGAVGDLADAIEAQLAGGAEVEARRRQGLERARFYTWERCAARHREAYRWAIDAYGGGARGGVGGDR